MDWRYVDENQFEWRLAVEEDPTTEKQAIKNRHTEEVEAESISYACLLYTSCRTVSKHARRESRSIGWSK